MHTTHLNETPVFSMPQFKLVTISGPDAADFLQRLTTVNVKKLLNDQLSAGLFLNSNGKIITFFQLIRRLDGFWLLTDTPELTQTSFEKMHFRENLKIEIVAESPKIYCYYESAFHEAAASLADQENILHFADRQCSWFVVKASAQSSFESKVNLSQHSTYYRVQNRYPNMLADDLASCLPLEVNLTEAVHENKGCYPGQEVIERIRSMGSAPRQLMVVDCSELATKNLLVKGVLPLLIDQQEVGRLTSIVQSPTNPQNWIGLALVKKNFLNQSVFESQNCLVKKI